MLWIRRPASRLFAFRLHQFVSRGDTVFASLEDPSRAATSRPRPSASVPATVSGCSSRSSSAGSAGRSTTAPWKDGSRRHDAVLVARAVRRSRIRRTPDHPVYLAPNTEDLWPADADAALGASRRTGSMPEAGSTKACQPLQPRLLARGPKRRRERRTGSDRPPPGALPVLPAMRGELQRPLHPRHRAADDAGHGGPQHGHHDPAACPPSGALRADATLAEKARKLLSFTDNRQDASLQAGHFNDFVEVGLLRAALYQGGLRCGTGRPAARPTRLQGVRGAGAAFDAYSQDPSLRFEAREQVDADAARGARLSRLSRPRARMANHRPQPRAVRSARHRLPRSFPAVRRPGCLGRTSTRSWRGATPETRGEGRPRTPRRPPA